MALSGDDILNYLKGVRGLLARTFNKEQRHRMVLYLHSSLEWTRQLPGKQCFLETLRSALNREAGKSSLRPCLLSLPESARVSAY